MPPPTRAGDTDWGDLELELHAPKPKTTTTKTTTSTKVTDIKVLVEVRDSTAPPKPAYWETELPKVALDAKPSTTLYHDGGCMKILARSRDGEYVACATYANADDTQAMKTMLVLQKKKQHQQQQQPDDEWVVVRRVKFEEDFQDTDIIITDAELQTTIQAKVQVVSSSSDEEEDSMHCFKPNKKKPSTGSTTTTTTKTAKMIDVSIPPATLMMMPSSSNGSVSCMTIHNAEQQQQQQHDEDEEEEEEETTDVVLDGLEAQAVGCFIKQHAQVRRQEIGDALRRFHGVNSNEDDARDFTLAYVYANSARFPSLLSLSKNIGRPSFSADKGPRLGKSPPLSDHEEFEGLFTLMAILKNMRNFVEQWSVTQQTQALFARSLIYSKLIAKRTEVAAVVWQLRRWLPLCKLLGKDEAHTGPLNPAKERWMQKRGVVLRAHIEKWIQAGEPSAPIVGPTPFTTMREWVDASLNEIVQQQQHPTSQSQQEQQQQQQQQNCYTDAMRHEDLMFMDGARKKLLSSIVAGKTPDSVEAKAKKIQKGFQQLAQDLMGHERNYKALYGLVDKMLDVLGRIHCGEQHVAKTMEELQQILQEPEDNPTLTHVEWLMQQRMAHIERHYGGELQETLEASRRILNHKRKLRETDVFLAEMAEFLAHTDA